MKLIQYKEDLTVNSEFSYDNKPNMNTLNVSSLNTMFETIFKNLNTKIGKNKFLINNKRLDYICNVKNKNQFLGY